MTAPLPDPNGDRAEAAKMNREDAAYEAAQQAEVDAMNAELFTQLQAEQDAENALYDTSVGGRHCGRRKGHEGPCNGVRRQSCPA